MDSIRKNSRPTGREQIINLLHFSEEVNPSRGCPLASPYLSIQVNQERNLLKRQLRHHLLILAAGFSVASPAAANWPALGRISNRTIEPVILLLEENLDERPLSDPPRIQVDRREQGTREVMCRKGLQAVVIAPDEEVYVQFQEPKAYMREAFALVDSAGHSVRMILERNEKRDVPTMWRHRKVDKAPPEAESVRFITRLDAVDEGLYLTMRGTHLPKDYAPLLMSDLEDEAEPPPFSDLAESSHHPSDNGLVGADLDLPQTATLLPGGMVLTTGGGGTAGILDFAAL